MNAEGIVLNELSQMEKAKNRVISLISEIQNRKVTNELTKENKKKLRYRQQNSGYQKGRDWKES